MSPDRERILKFTDWVLSIFRQEWVDATPEERKAAFEKINRALEMRVDLMKMIAYDYAIQEKQEMVDKKPSPPPKQARKPTSPPPPIE